MGWLHVASDGYGISMDGNEFNARTMLSNIPKLGITIDRDFIEHFARSILQTNAETSERDAYISERFGGFPNVDEMNEEQKIMFFARMGKDVEGDLWVNGESKYYDELTVEDVQTLLDNLDDDYNSNIWDVFGILFCEKYGYPQNAFTSCSDYNGNKMFYCTARFPISKGEEALCSLTEEKYIEQLSEFFSILTGTEYKAELEFCEEYVKE